MAVLKKHLGSTTSVYHLSLSLPCSSLTCTFYLAQTGGYYYLFTSFDACCDGTSSTYNIRVSRATTITGPYTDESGVAALSSGGTEILGTHGTIYGPGGQSLLADDDAVALFYRTFLYFFGHQGTS